MAEALYRRALAIDEQSYGLDHPHVAIDLNGLATLLEKSNRLAEPEPLCRRAIHSNRQFRYADELLPTNSRAWSPDT